MSKSYDNAIPLFAPREQLRKLIAGIVTDSRAPGEPKDVEGSALFQIYQAFASTEETDALRQAYADGIGWGDAKKALFERIDSEIAPMRERYEALMADPAGMETILLAGAAKARELATPFMAELRAAVGLRRLGTQRSGALAGAVSATPSPAGMGALPTFKQYREKDGQFYFKLVDAKGQLLLQSTGFASPRDAGQAIARLQGEAMAALADLAGQVVRAPQVSPATIDGALKALQRAAAG
jgi:tryptophanyl-tRNA synthetase